MRIRLVYEGELRANQRSPEAGQSDKLASHKQEIRREFHKQLRHHWKCDWFLSSHKVFGADYGADRAASDYRARWAPDSKDMVFLKDAVANSYADFDYRFVPLVTKRWKLKCDLSILFLRHDPPGAVLSSGDLDNRIKTLIDALRMPAGRQELVGNEMPATDEDPFYCLLEDDKLVSGIHVESDRLLKPPSSNQDKDRRQVHVVVTADVKPLDVTSFNLSFAS